MDRKVDVYCGHQWTETQCFQCEEFSPHEHWYHYPDEEQDSGGLEEVLEQEVDADV
jgi:hypothetical protein